MNLHNRPPTLMAISNKPLAPSLERLRLRVSIISMLLDVAAIFAGFLIIGKAYHNFTAAAWQEASLIAPLFWIFGVQGGLYKPDLLLSLRRAIYKCIYGLALAVIVLLILLFYAKITESFSRFILTFGCIFALVFMISFRVILAAWLRRTVGSSLYNTLIIQAGGPGVEISHAYEVDAQEHGIRPELDNPASLDRIGRYMENMDRVIVSCPQEERDLWAPVLRAAGVEAEFVSGDLWRLGALKIRKEAGFTGIVVSVRPLGPGARVIKRSIDLGIASLALLTLAPLMAIIALLIKLEDGGPIFFRQQRVGTGNRFFWMYKFRSMSVELCDWVGDRSASRDDNRATHVGRLLRRTSLDELPQFFNVWRGDMSLVGPRPHALGSQAGKKLFWEVDGRYWNRHALKPGLTGLAQIRGLRGATEHERDLADRLQADLEYIANWSLWLDAQIIIRTFGVLLHDRAY